LPATIQDPGLTPYDEPIEDVVDELVAILMDEFVAPAMALGQNLLVPVYRELARLQRVHPDKFRNALGTALAQIRTREEAWFARVLGTPPPVPQFDVPPELQATHDRIVQILGRYYEAVLAEAEENKVNLFSRLKVVRDQVDDEEDFADAFRAAMGRTRQVEDQAFAAFLGPGALRIPVTEAVGSRAILRQGTKLGLMLG